MLVVLAVIGGAAVNAESAESRLRVDYQPPVLKVEADAVPLADVLRAIGERIGFSVVETGGAQSPLTVSVRGSVEQVLSELLMGTNHAVIYLEPRRGAAESPSPIEAVVLLGAGSGGAVAKADAVSAGPGHADSGPPSQADSVAIAKTSGPPSTTVISETSAWLDAPSIPDDTPAVSRLLRDQAVATLPISPERASPPASSVPAVMRQVQQDVQAVVEALKTASQALMESVNNRGK